MSGGGRLTQVVPRLPPIVDGVGDYATTLAAELARRFGITTRFIAAGAAGSQRSAEAPPNDPTAIRLAPGAPISETLAAALAQAGAETVLLHFVNYAYHSRGCPRRLVAEVLRWRRENPRRRLVTLFHEVYASGPPWRSSFWLSPFQRHLAAQLARASDEVVSSLEIYRRLLAAWVPAARVTLAPVFSTVGEPATVAALAARQGRRLVVFGSAGVRRRAYRAGREDLAAACRTLAIDEIVDLGAAVAEIPREVAGIPVHPQGLLPEAAVDAHLAGAFAGFLAYPKAFLAKSTVFAAYCAHGLLPVCSSTHGTPADMGSDTDGLFWHPRSADTGDLQTLADAARGWYLGHSLPRQAETFRALLQLPPCDC